jgi:hypothetical protein
MSTLLDGVNALLFARGMSPVNTILSGHPLQAQAVALLEKHKKNVNSMRWWYNIDADVQLIRQADTRVRIPGDVISIDYSGYIALNGFLYDTAENSFYFDEDPSEVTLVYDRAWEELPTEAFTLISELAKEEFVRPMNDQFITQGASNDAKIAYYRMQVVDLRNKDVSTANNPLVSKWQAKMIQR